MPLGVPSATSSPATIKPEAIALLGFFEIVRGDENGGAGVGEAIDHAPEGAAGEGIDAGGWFVEKEHARLVHDGGAEGYALLPSARKAAGDLVLLAFEAGEGEHPATSFLRARFRGRRRRRRRSRDFRAMVRSS